MRWSNPEVSSDAVTITQVTFVRDPGYQEWRIGATGHGQAVVKATGSPNCGPGQVCPMYVILFSVTIIVA